MIRAIIHTKSVKCNGPSLARLKLCKIEPLKLKLVLFKAETDLKMSPLIPFTPFAVPIILCDYLIEF